MYYQPSTGLTFVDQSAVRAGVNALFSEVITDDMLEFVGVFELVSSPPAVTVDQTVDATSIEQVDGVWTQMWAVRAATQEELDARAAAAKAAVPQQVSRRQARQALLLGGLLDKVQPAIDAIADATQRGLAQIEWDDSQVYERQRPILISLAAAIGLDSDGLDQLFITAGGL